MELFRLLKDKISPLKPPRTDAMSPGTGGTRLDDLQHTDPFNDTTRDGEIKESLRLDDGFIRNSNLNKLNQTQDMTCKKVEMKCDEITPVVEEEPHKQPSLESNREEERLDEEEDVTLEILEEMNRLEESFPILTTDYRLIDKIGEGTFSTVYKAEALNGIIKLGSDIWQSPPLKKKQKESATKKPKNPIVAIKQIYVTSSPNRIHNELNLLYILSGNSHVAPLLDVLRYQDQVLAILPYYQHSDFRDFYRDLSVKGIKKYLWELFHALDFVHTKGIIHRDLKPTNFLYDPFKGKGVLVDFGLAEKYNPLTASSNRSSNSCPCTSRDKEVISRSYTKRLNIKPAYPKQDQRPPRRANRAGTRGFRAPEVLFKCNNQCTKIDIWSAGIIGYSLLSRKFPLFNSPDDTDAILELALIFGFEKLKKCAELHGCGLVINLDKPDTMNGNLVKILHDLLAYENEQGCIPEDSVIHDTLKLFNETGDKFVRPIEPSEHDDSGAESFEEKLESYRDHKHLMELLYSCFIMDPSKRLCAKQMLKLPFFDELATNLDDEILL